MSFGFFLLEKFAVPMEYFGLSPLGFPPSLLIRLKSEFNFIRFCGEQSHLPPFLFFRISFRSSLLSSPFLVESVAVDIEDAESEKIAERNRSAKHGKRMFSPLILWSQTLPNEYSLSQFLGR